MVAGTFSVSETADVPCVVSCRPHYVKSNVIMSLIS